MATVDSKKIHILEPEIFSHGTLEMHRFLTGLGEYYELENVC